MPSLNWDTVIIGILLGGAGLGFLLRKARMITYLASTYLAYICANELGVWLARFLSNFNLDVGVFVISFGLFFLITIALAVEERFLSNQVHIPMGVYENVEGAFYGMLVGGAFLTLTFMMMHEYAHDLLLQFQARSQLLIHFLNPYLRFFFLVFPIGMIALSSLLGRFKGE